MKSRFTAHGYFRAILLSILAACAIEAIINADDVKRAFAKGRRQHQEAVASVRASADSWLQMPQQISQLAGKVYYTVFE